MFVELLLSAHVVLFSTVRSDTTSQCEPEETAFAAYWTTSNQFRPDGCIDRAAVTLVQIDHGADDDFFWKLPRAAASRACQTFGGMNCDIQNPDQFNLNAMAKLIVDAVYVDDIYGLAVTLPDTVVYDDIASVAQQEIEVSALNSGINDWQELGATMFVGQSDYVAGYDACLHLQAKYGCTKFLMLDHQGGNHNGVLDRGFGCNDAMNQNNTRIFVSNGANTAEVPIVVDALNADPDLDCVMALGANPETYVNTLLTDPDPATNWGIDASRLTADRVKAMAAFDYNGDIFDRIEGGESVTKFAIDQQPFLQGFIPMMLMGLKASTGAHVMEPTQFNSGPAFIETAEQVGLLACFAQDVYYCHDDAEHLATLDPSCACIDTTQKTIHLFHHGGDADDGTALSNFYGILSNAVTVAAADFNISLEVHTYSHEGNALDLDSYKASIEEVLASDLSEIAGIITTIPNREIGELLLHNADLEHLEIVGVADGYALYEELTSDPAHLSARQSMYVGMNEPQTGASMAWLVHNHAMDVNMWVNDTAAYNGVLLCLDDEKGELASLVERCEGAAEFAAENDLTLLTIDVADKQNIETTLDGIRDAVGVANVSGIIATGEASCVAAVSYISEVESDNNVQVALGCFDASNVVLDLLLDDDAGRSEIDFIFDQQPYLVGYAATMLLANKILLGMIPAQLLVETGPKLITFADEKVVKTKQCENLYLGYDFCPSEALTVSAFEVNHPTTGNFGGVILILLFALTVLLSLIVWAVMYVWRSESMFKGLQWEFMSMTMLGGIVMMLSGLLVMGGDSLTAFQCNGPYAIWSVGFTIFFVSYALRVWKVVVLIENGLLFKRRPITQKHLFLRLAVFTVIDVLLVIIAASATPFEVNTDVTVEEEVSDDGEISSFREVTTTYCTFSSSFSAMWIIVFVYKFVILLWVISIAMRKQILADKVKKLKFMKFEEGSNIAIGIYMVVISFLVFGLIAFALGTSSTLFSSTLQWTIISFLSFICYVTIICCVVLHRVVYVLNKGKVANKTADMVAGSQTSGATSQQSSTRPESTVEASVDETALDPLLQRAEFLANELLEVISNPQFSQSAAMSMADIMRQMQEKLNRKEMSRTNNATEVELAES
mmetsp:Transcript_15111/g.22871  ORF Transcript_15111/g.22871 Transcript_15111/m.22871 type:complete len:1124 (+) Transcript_15111:124-3495(+)|eukprot:CAMPEP_0202693180 /NCGR_PEP_ID=MMETSP1385-20130828/7350_1 /ASSEMBLY_ACC=CAM_ASM_000861 /TAXON_ID=933848 /ORGANISM="Elphidium margaritaceum" /LENGTH=1123 /DNA_ID=CAMNT_0049348827 /DNA_START=104 /DNA_END=3475 /DNA_ORIENTATION=-